MTHYVYKIYDPITLEYYIGSRSCKGNSKDDVNYMGSMYTWKPDKSRLIKIIIDDTFKKRIDANREEKKLIQECINDALNRNYHIPDIGFCCIGVPKSKEHKLKLSKARKLLFATNATALENNKKAQIKRWKSANLRNRHSIIMSKINSTVEYINKQIASAKDKSKPVLQYDMCGNFIKEYESIHAASRELNKDKTPISKNCNGKTYKSAYGFIWKFKN